MKILLVQNMVYVPTLGGANKANRLLLEGLAGKGHECHVVAPALGAKVSLASREQFLGELAARSIVFTARDGVDIFRQCEVEVHAVTDSTRLRRQVIEHVQEFAPTWILVTSEDPEQLMLDAALEADGSRIVYLVHTPLMLPFGPNCFLQNPQKTEQFKRCAGVITVSRYVKEYIRRWSGVDSVVIPFPVYGSRPFANFGCFDKGYVTLVNPCAYKGLPIFLDLAGRLPEVQFAAVPTWGTTRSDRAALASFDNIVLLDPADEIDEILAQTRILLMPSLWIEAFPLLPVEAMLRGIPVIASNAGGLPEAKLGIDYILPVRTIEQYQEQLDELGNPLPVVPPQETDTWERALGRLLSDRAHYQKLSQASRVAAHSFVSGVGVEPFEEYLEKLAPARPIAQAESVKRQPQDVGNENLRARLSQLSPERLELLARRLRKREGPP
jgi:glycosyltransferase involved in cell wall biosynthesis